MCFLESPTGCNFFQDYLPNMLNCLRRKVLPCYLAICPGDINYDLEPLEIFNISLQLHFPMAIKVDYRSQYLNLTAIHNSRLTPALCHMTCQ